MSKPQYFCTGLIRIVLIVVVLTLVVGCSSQSDNVPETAVPDFTLGDPLEKLPEVARQATHAGAPRPPAYWTVWNSCAPDNRSAEAAANGGPAAGWWLVDDIIARPGIQLGNYPVESCEQGLVLLQAAVSSSGGRGDLIRQLAGQLLAAELNLNAGAESCPIAEESVVGAHITLAQTGFEGQPAAGNDLGDELAETAAQFILLLEAYNRGDLCR